MGGQAWGVPLPIVYPSHDDGILAIRLEPGKVHYRELSIVYALGDVLFYGIFVGFPLLTAWAVAQWSRETLRAGRSRIGPHPGNPPQPR
jgi:hypothetical protein